MKISVIRGQRRFILIVLTLALCIGGLQAVTRAGAQATGEQGGPTMQAKLIDPEKKAQGKSATVDVKVTGLKLTDPAAVNEKPMMGQGHLHYQVDDGPVIATTTTKLSFHGLTPGQHKIVVMLAGNDHSPLGPQETLNVTIP
jgi:hypothetical protein